MIPLSPQDPKLGPQDLSLGPQDLILGPQDPKNLKWVLRTQN